MRIFANADFPFLSWRRKAYMISAVMLVIGLGAMIVNTVSTGSWLNYGVDFTGGTLVQVNFTEQVQIEEIRAIDAGWQITRFGEPEESEFLIRVPIVQEEVGTDPAAEVREALSAEFGEGSFEIGRTEAVSARVGDELQVRALLAILISFAGTMLYLAFRFEWRFGLASLVATVHDVIIPLGFLAALQMEISVTTIAALLTIVGYSLNDTIIVFDRVRENLTKRKREDTFGSIIDRSINDTLPRTVLTSLTTLTTLLSLYLFGGAVIRDFALVLIMGIVVGTFSSIFVAAPALDAIVKKWPHQPKKTARSGGSRRREAAVV